MLMRRQADPDLVGLRELSSLDPSSPAEQEECLALVE
jgi:hypothetical protein